MVSYNFRNFCVLIIILCVQYEESPAKNSTKKGSKKNNTSSPIQIRAVLGSCKNKTNPMQPLASEVTDCNRRLIIRIKMNYFGQTCLDNQFVVIHHAYDAVTDKKLRLLHPVVVRLKQELIYQIYQLHPMKVMINSEATEEVINNESTNFTGCNTASTTPTCGFTYLNKAVVPFSEGFCCSCDESVNEVRQPCEGNSGSRCDEERKHTLSLINVPLDRVSRDVKLKHLKKQETSNKLNNLKHSCSNKHIRYTNNEKLVPSSKYTININDIKKLHSEYGGNLSASVPDNKQFLKIHDTHYVPYGKILSNQPNLYKHMPKEMSYVDKSGSPHHYELYSIDQNIKKLQPTENNSDKLIRSNIYSTHDIQDKKKLDKMELRNKSNELSYFSIMKPMLFNESTPISEHKGNLLNTSHLKTIFPEGSSIHVLDDQDFSELISDSSSDKPHPSKKEILTKLKNSVTKFRELPQKSALNNNLDGIKLYSRKGTHEKHNCKSGDCDFPEDKQENHDNKFINDQRYSSRWKFPENEENIPFTQEQSIKISDYLKRKEFKHLNNQRTSKRDPSELKTIVSNGKSNKIIQKRDASTNDRQIRGWQSCTSCNDPPPCADPETYYESAHCLRYSDLWLTN